MAVVRNFRTSEKIYEKEKRKWKKENSKSKNYERKFKIMASERRPLQGGGTIFIKFVTPSKNAWTMTPMEVRQLQVNEYAAQRNMPYDEAKTFLRGAEFADRTPRWVKVSDQLPAKVGNEYLVCDEDACICIASYEGDGEFYIYRNTAIKVSATHWQPLPGVPDEYYPEDL